MRKALFVAAMMATIAFVPAGDATVAHDCGAPVDAPNGPGGAPFVAYDATCAGRIEQAGDPADFYAFDPPTDAWFTIQLASHPGGVEWCAWPPSGAWEHCERWPSGPIEFSAAGEEGAWNLAVRRTYGHGSYALEIADIGVPPVADDCGTGADAPYEEPGVRLDAGATCSATLGWYDDADAWTVAVAADESVSVGFVAGPDVALRTTVWRPDGEWAAFADGGGPFVLHGVAMAGDWTLVVKRAGGRGAYDAHAEAAPPRAPDDDCASGGDADALVLADGAACEGRLLHGFDDEDTYLVGLVAGQAYALDVDAPSRSTVLVTFRQPDGRILEEEYAPLDTLYGFAEADGLHELEVRVLAGATDATYALEVRTEASVTAVEGEYLGEVGVSSAVRRQTGSPVLVEARGGRIHLDAPATEGDFVFVDRFEAPDGPAEPAAWFYDAEGDVLEHCAFYHSHWWWSWDRCRIPAGAVEIELAKWDFGAPGPLRYAVRLADFP